MVPVTAIGLTSAAPAGGAESRTSAPAAQNKSENFRVCSKITWGFAGGNFGFWRGATKEHSPGSVTEEQRSQKPKSPQPTGAGRRLAGCGVARRSQPHRGAAPSSRLASGQAALPPKPQVIFEQTLRVISKLITQNRVFDAKLAAFCRRPWVESMKPRKAARRRAPLCSLSYGSYCADRGIDDRSTGER